MLVNASEGQMVGGSSPPRQCQPTCRAFLDKATDARLRPEEGGGVEASLKTNSTGTDAASDILNKLGILHIQSEICKYEHNGR